jgi:Fe-S cluster biogenesis protein NfuA
MNKAKKDIIHRIENSLDTLRPFLEQDGGNIEVLDITDDFIVKIKLIGNCEACPMSDMTMKAGVEQAIKSAVPEVVRVDAV